MANINFISGGMMGDFIQGLFVVKNICKKRGEKAVIYMCEGCGDRWTFGIEKAYDDLYELIMAQDYVASFQIGIPENEFYIDINKWRERSANEFATTGSYNTCWTELLAEQFGFEIPYRDYKWMKIDKISPDVQGKVLIHRSTHRHGGLPWREMIDQINEEILFLTCNTGELDAFKSSWFFQGVDLSKVKPHPVNDINEMAIALNSCKYFIGNQSAPFSLANALDIPRLGELEAGVWKFYRDEHKYSKNISWFLSNKEKHYTDNALIRL